MQFGEIVMSERDYVDGYQLNHYQQDAADTAVYPKAAELIYLTNGLAGEAGEVANKFKKLIRSSVITDDMKLSTLTNIICETQPLSIKEELGDVLWYVSQLAKAFGWSLEDIAMENIAKLRNRKEKGTLKLRPNAQDA